jgi:hypothetical protein
MTAWAKPRDLLIAYKFASQSEWRRHIAKLEELGYPFLAQLQKELARGDREGRSDAAGPAGKNRSGEGVGSDGGR